MLEPTVAQIILSSCADDLDPEKVAYWHFRLNGFFQIENFVVHPARHGGQRTGWKSRLISVGCP